MKTSICIFLLISFVFSQEIRVYGDSINSFYESRNRNNIKIYPMRMSKYNENKVYPFMEKTKLFSQHVKDNYYGIEVSYKGKNGFYVHTAIIPFEEDVAYLFVIPGIPTSVFSSRTTVCYINKIIENWSKMEELCYVKVNISKEFREQLDNAFKRKFMSISNYLGDIDTTFQLNHYNKGVVEEFGITFNESTMDRFSSLFNEYKSLYFLIKEYLMVIPSDCTRKNVISNIEKICGVSWRDE
jgi:hypothetical protein